MKAKGVENQSAQPIHTEKGKGFFAAANVVFSFFWSRAFILWLRKHRRIWHKLPPQRPCKSKHASTYNYPEQNILEISTLRFSSKNVEWSLHFSHLITFKMHHMMLQICILHPRNLTWNLKNPPNWKGNSSSKPPLLGLKIFIFQGVSLENWTFQAEENRLSNSKAGHFERCRGDLILAHVDEVELHSPPNKDLQPKRIPSLIKFRFGMACFQGGSVRHMASHSNDYIHHSHSHSTALPSMLCRPLVLALFSRSPWNLIQVREHGWYPSGCEWFIPMVVRGCPL